MVTDPQSGEIIAACSTPLPDFSNLTDPSPSNLKPVSSSYEPGSVFKVITTSIGLDLGLYTRTPSMPFPPLTRWATTTSRTTTGATTPRTQA